MLRKIAINLSISLHTGLDYIQMMPLTELRDLLTDLHERNEEIKRDNGK